MSRCGRCRAKLGVGAVGRYCSGCEAYLQVLRHRPPEVDRAFWDAPEIRKAARERNMGRLLAAYRHHPHHGIPVPQEAVGFWANLTQSQISRYENGSPDRQIDRLIHWARLLGIPQLLLWFDMPGRGEHAEQRSDGSLVSDGVWASDPMAPLLARTTGNGTVSEGEALSQLRERIEAANRVRSATADARPSLILIGGYAGSGKTELGHLLARLTGWPLLDKDVLTRPLVESLLYALHQDPNDRQSDIYRDRVRPVEYRALLNAVLTQLGVGSSCLVTAPFLQEMPDERWLKRLQRSCIKRGVDLIPLWVDADPETMYDYLVRRDAARDSWKLNHWDHYAATLDPDLRPALPHLVVNNAQHAAISLPAQANDLAQLLSPT
jgi:predicted kinase/transcriptional regulator with XRE-family HTH domain